MAPAKLQIDPTSLRSRLRLFFVTNHGQHRPSEVAKVLGLAPRAVANECARMARSGDLVRSRPEGTAAQGPGVTYGLAPTPPTEENT